jgi:drug/metabolite transporter (DMT)-like permease
MTAPAHRPSTNLAFGALLLGAIGIAFAAVLAKLAVNADGLVGGVKLSPVAVAFWRMALALPFFWTVVVVRKPPIGPLTWRLILPGLCFALDMGVWHWSFEFTTVANATLEANIAAVIVPVVSYFFLGERFRPLFIFGAVLALLGIARLVGFSIAAEGDAWIGDLMGVGVASAYAGYLISSKILLGRYPVNFVIACATTGCAAFLLIGALLTPGRFFPATGAAWVDLVALAITAQIIGQGLIAFGMSRLPAGFSAVTLVLQPVVAAFLGWIMLAQAMTSGQMLAGLVVIVGIVLARFGTVAK